MALRGGDNAGGGLLRGSADAHYNTGGLRGHNNFLPPPIPSEVLFQSTASPTSLSSQQQQPLSSSSNRNGGLRRAAENDGSAYISGGPSHIASNNNIAYMSAAAAAATAQQRIQQYQLNGGSPWNNNYNLQRGATTDTDLWDKDWTDDSPWDDSMDESSNISSIRSSRKSKKKKKHEINPVLAKMQEDAEKRRAQKAAGCCGCGNLIWFLVLVGIGFAVYKWYTMKKSPNPNGLLGGNPSPSVTNNVTVAGANGQKTCCQATCGACEGSCKTCALSTGVCCALISIVFLMKFKENAHSLEGLTKVCADSMNSVQNNMTKNMMLMQKMMYDIMQKGFFTVCPCCGCANQLKNCCGKVLSCGGLCPFDDSYDPVKEVGEGLTKQCQESMNSVMDHAKDDMMQMQKMMEQLMEKGLKTVCPCLGCADKCDDCCGKILSCNGACPSDKDPK